jgi:hypothetical protein
VTIAITTGRVGAHANQVTVPQRSGRTGGGRRHRLRRILVIAGISVVSLVALVAGYAGYTLYKIDHAVHHVGVPASLLAKGKNDLLAIVRGPNHFEQIFVFHAVNGQTKILKVPSALALPLASGQSAPIDSLSIHAPATIIAGLSHLGIPVSHYVGVDLHMVSPNSSLGQLATGKLSISSMISDPTGTSSLLQQVASHIYLGPGTPVSAVLSLMNVPTAHPVSVPTNKDDQGHVVVASAFGSVMRNFL